MNTFTILLIATFVFLVGFAGQSVFAERNITFAYPYDYQGTYYTEYDTYGNYNVDLDEDDSYAGFLLFGKTSYHYGFQDIERVIEFGDAKFIFINNPVEGKRTQFELEDKIITQKLDEFVVCSFVAWC